MRRLGVVMLAAALMLAGVRTLVRYGLAIDPHRWTDVDPVHLAADATEDVRIAAVDRWLDNQFEKNRFNGGVLLVRDGKILFMKTYGYTDHTASKRLNQHSAFRLASVSKQFTAAAILRLAEMRQLKLDDQVSKHLDGFPLKGVTIRHLLNQTSGIPDEYMDLAEEHRDEVGQTLTIASAVKLVSKYSSAVRSPGKRFEYSNTNYVLLAGIVEKASGQSFEEFLGDEIFEPLGMKDSRVWNLLSGDRSDNQTSDFDQVNDRRKPLEPSWLDGVAGDGAVFCSLHDFVIWDRFWKSNAVVSGELLAEAVKRPNLKSGKKSDYGFGWIVERDHHWHDGAWLGANTYVMRSPKTGCCLVILDNSSNMRFDKIVQHLENAFRPIIGQ